MSAFTSRRGRKRQRSYSRGADLKLDYDGELPMDWIGRLAWLCQMMRWRVRATWIRRTRNGWHVGVLLTRRPTPLKVIAAQAILGSDWRREAYNLMKWRRRWPVGSVQSQLWNVLFVRKYGKSVIAISDEITRGREWTG